MKKNIGTLDRVLRFILAIIVASGIFFVDSITSQVILAVVSLFILFQALAGWCFLYSLLGISTCPVDLKK